MTPLRAFAGATILGIVVVFVHAACAQTGSSPVYFPYPPGVIPADLDQEIQRVQGEVDHIFQQALAQWRALPSNSSTRMPQVQLLGKLLLFDKNLSVNRNQACSFCHMPYTAFTGPISSLNATTVAYPGSVPWRFGHRKPQSYTYAPFYPGLQYNHSQQDFYGGNFWDLRATGYKLQSPAAEQAQDPPVDPNEMGFPDTACVVHRLSQSAYRPLFETVWGSQAFRIDWPADIDHVCSRAVPPRPHAPGPVQLRQVDRDRANATYDQFGLAIAAYEAAPDVSPFSSKFDDALANPDQPVLSADELAGWNLFRGKAKCNTCHLDGTENRGKKDVGGGPMTPGDAAGVAPLFTDFTSSNLGLPKNVAMPYYYETTPDSFGFTPNPQGFAFLDKGVGDFLRGSLNPNAGWTQYADRFDGKMQNPTLRNVDMRPYPAFVKAYMHHGYLKSLKEVVHFYNTRDTLGPCGPGKIEKVTCWPPPEIPQNVNKTIGNLGLSEQEEDQLVAFLKTLTDGYTPPAAKN